MGKTSFHCPRCHCFTLHWYGKPGDRHKKCFGCGYDSREDDGSADVILDRMEARYD